MLCKMRNKWLTKLARWFTYNNLNLCYARPIGRVNAGLNQSMKRRMWPIRHLIHQAMLKRINVYIIHMRRVVFFTLNRVFPISPLPNATLTFGCTHHRKSLGFRDGFPTRRKIVITHRQRPNTMHMVRQYHPCINMKRFIFAHHTYRSPQTINTLNQQARAAFQQIHRKKVSTTGHTVTSIIRHKIL